jgi:cell division protein FtsN
MSVAKIQPSEEDWARIIENQRWLNELSAKEQRQEEQERLEAEEEERAYQLWRDSMGTPAYDPTSPSLASAHATQEREQQAAYADALASARARIDACPLSRKAYGPFAEDMIIAHAKCSVKFPLYSKEWDAELEKHDVIHLYRQWCWDKSSISISKGW